VTVNLAINIAQAALTAALILAWLHHETADRRRRRAAQSSHSRADRSGQSSV
jgi:hypothetical protein